MRGVVGGILYSVRTLGLSVSGRSSVALSGAYCVSARSRAPPGSACLLRGLPGYRLRTQGGEPGAQSACLYLHIDADLVPRHVQRTDQRTHWSSMRCLRLIAGVILALRLCTLSMNAL